MDDRVDESNVVEMLRGSATLVVPRASDGLFVALDVNCQYLHRLAEQLFNPRYEVKR